MKKIISTFSGLLFGVISFGQTISYNPTTDKDISLKDVTNINISKTITVTQHASLPFKISKVGKGENITLTIADKNEGTATLGTDYTYSTPLDSIVLAPIPGSDDTKVFSVAINKMPPVKSTNAIFSINIKNGGRLNKTYVIVVNFNSDDDNIDTQNDIDENGKKKPASADSAIYAFNFLNAANFDITGIGKTSYLGHVNVFRYPDSKHRFGFNAGLMKISYSADSTTKMLSYKNVTTDLFQFAEAPKVGSKYHKQVSYLSNIITNTAYSLYIQPSWQLMNNTEGSRLFIHGHIELLVFKTTTTTNHTGFQQKDTVYTVQDSVNHLRLFPNDTLTRVYKRTNLNGYFGLGLTYMYKDAKSCFYIQGTLGGTTDFPNFNSYLGSTAHPQQNKWNTFYLVRANYSAKLADSTTLVFGTDIRGLFPRYDPLYAMYVGLNLNIDALSKLVSGK